MPSLDTGSALLPFNGSTPQTRHASLSGARVAVCRASSQAARMLARYLTYGPLSDGEQAKALGLPEGRISARRAGLLVKGWVAYESIVAGPYGAFVTRWQLTAAGRAVAQRMTR